jgi:hypothetical protein
VREIDEELPENFAAENKKCGVRSTCRARRTQEEFMCTETAQTLAIGLFVADVNRLSAKYLNVFLEERMAARVAQFNIVRAGGQIEMPQFA